MSAPALSRRTLLGAGAALGVAGIPTSAGAGIIASDPDAGLLDLIRRHGEAVEAVVKASVVGDEAWLAALTGYPPRPEALRWQPDDFPRTGLGPGLSDRGEGEERWYRERGVAWMRDRPAARWFPGRASPLGAADEARRVEIVAAWDGWQADRRAIDDLVGHTAASAAEDAAGDLVEALAQEVKRARPRSLSGLRALAEWFGRQAAAGAAHDDALAQLAAAVAAFGGAAS